jgi:hypothetical protein
VPRADSAEVRWCVLLTAAARGGLLASLAGATFRVGQRAVHVQDLLNNIVNLSEHENANFFLPLGRRQVSLGGKWRNERPGRRLEPTPGTYRNAPYEGAS